MKVQHWLFELAGEKNGNKRDTKNMRGRRLSVNIGCTHREQPRKRLNHADLLSKYSEKILADGYRAFKRGDRLEARSEFFMEQTRTKKEDQQIVASGNSAGVSRLRRMEGRFVWALTLREKVSNFVLQVCRIKHQSRLRDHRKAACSLSLKS